LSRERERECFTNLSMEVMSRMNEHTARETEIFNPDDDDDKLSREQAKTKLNN